MSTRPKSDDDELWTPGDAACEHEAQGMATAAQDIIPIARRRSRGQRLENFQPPPIPEISDITLARADPSQNAAKSRATTLVAEGWQTQWLGLALIIPLCVWTLRGAFAADFWCAVDYVNLPFHEAGHVIFSPLGDTLHILGGTLGQLLVPASLCGYFLGKQYQPFGAAFCLWWFGENLVNIARYMADARELILPLVGGGDHDWNELFYRWGLLTEPAVNGISTATHCVGIVFMLAGLACCVLFVLPIGRRESLVEGILSRWRAVAILFN